MLHSIILYIKCANKITATGDHSAVEVDVGSSKSVQTLLNTVLKQYNAPPTIVVNSAGITRDNWLLKLSEEDYDAVLNVNLKVMSMELLHCTDK